MVETKLSPSLPASASPLAAAAADDDMRLVTLPGLEDLCVSHHICIYGRKKEKVSTSASMRHACYRPREEDMGSRTEALHVTRGAVE